MGIPVLDSDAVVHDLYAPGGAAVEPVRALFGASVVAVDGGISRSALGAFVLGPENEANMRALEAAVHPLVDDARWAFLDAAEADAHPLVVIDIPLLYEKGYEDTVDAVMVASTGDADEQRARALARPGMTPEKFESILARQVPDEKNASGRISSWRRNARWRRRRRRCARSWNAFAGEGGWRRERWRAGETRENREEKQTARESARGRGARRAAANVVGGWSNTVTVSM